MPNQLSEESAKCEEDGDPNIARRRLNKRHYTQRHRQHQRANKNRGTAPSTQCERGHRCITRARPCVSCRGRQRQGAPPVGKESSSPCRGSGFFLSITNNRLPWLVSFATSHTIGSAHR